MTTFDRFISKTVFKPDTGCLIWIGGKTKHGYGQFRVGKRIVRAHRWAFEQVFGPITSGHVLDHYKINANSASCDTSCVNWQHLEAVTHKENIRRSPIVRESSRRNGLRRAITLAHPDWTTEAVDERISLWVEAMKPSNGELLDLGLATLNEELK